MSEFKKVQSGTFSPTKCLTCGTHEGPFVDTEVELPIYGHVYICTSTESRPGCIRQMARLDFMVDVEMWEKAEHERDTLEARIMHLEENRMVSMDELKELVGRK